VEQPEPKNLVNILRGPSGTPVFEGLLPIPDRLVALTFDDCSTTHLEHVAPRLRSAGFGATFFANGDFCARGASAGGGGSYYCTWDQVRGLHEAGFEIGNHLAQHVDVRQSTADQFADNLVAMERLCAEHGIPKPTTFCYPGYHVSRQCLPVLEDKGYLFARRGCEPYSPFWEFQEGGRGPAYQPLEDHPLLIPTTGSSGPKWDYDDFMWAVEQARDGDIAVLTFHGVPDLHEHCTTDPADFERYLEFLELENCTVIALRDLANYIDPALVTGDPFAPIERRRKVTPSQLKSEYLVNPLGLDMPRPRLSWVLESSRRGQFQTAYQISVATDSKKLAAGEGDCWDSGKVVSDRSVNIEYDGRDLESGETCYWKVRSWDIDDEAGPWSAPATFEMGLLESQDWTGGWIAADDKEISSPLLRQEFLIDSSDIVRARAYVCGLGYFELYANGERVGDNVLAPATTYYNNDQPFKLKDRVLYVVHDITEYLRSGANAVGLMLGHGWFSKESDIPVSPWHRDEYGDRPVAIVQINIELGDGSSLSISTDGSWKTSSGPVRYNDYNHGETYDATQEQEGWHEPGFDDSGWASALSVPGPAGVLTAQKLPPIRVVETLRAVDSWSLGEGVHVFDLGRSISGWVKLRVRGDRGTVVTLRHAQTVFDDGRLDQRSNRSMRHPARQSDAYVLKGAPTAEVWEPRFTLHGFRYVEVTGFPGTPTLDDIEGRFVHSALEECGQFRCSNGLLNQIEGNVRRTFSCSLQGMPQDAIDRSERVGWLGDPGFVAEDYMYTLDGASFWTKWLDDIADSQKEDGFLPVVSPIHWRDPYDSYWEDSIEWHSSYPLFVWNVYWYYDDERILKAHYDGLAKLEQFTTALTEGHLLDVGAGDHMEPQADGTSRGEPVHTPADLTANAYYYIDVWILAEVARILGRAEDAKRYSELAGNIKKAFNEKYLDGTTDQYGPGTQCANAVALHLDLVPEGRAAAVVDNLIRGIEENEGNLSTGIIGTNCVVQALSMYERADIMFDVATRTTLPSWGYQVMAGATTIWETWEGDPHYSLNMKMFGSVQKFFYRDIAGVRSATPGYGRLIVKPQVVGDLEWAAASLNTIRGRVDVDWRKGVGSFELNVTVPVNCHAEVSVPKLGLQDVTIEIRGITVWKEGSYVASSATDLGSVAQMASDQPGVEGVTGGRESVDCVTFDAGSGRYDIRLRGRQSD
jgi:alpha-L-rhamnosidase